MQPITPEQYFGHMNASGRIQPEHRANADILLVRVNTLLARAERDGVVMTVNPHTGNLISGNGAGGWRLPDSPVGSALSAHKTGQAVDVYDPHDGALDQWCMDNQDALAELGLYLEHPAATKGWCHLSTRAPRSGHRVFYP